MFIRSVSEKPDAHLHLVGFPGAGGSRAHFAAWDGLLGPRVRLSVVDPWMLHFAQEREGLTRLDDVASLLVSELAALERPAVLVGHSRGSLVAYEVAQQLTAAGHGEQVSALIALAHRAPVSAPTHLVSRGGTDLLRRFLADMGGTPPEVFDDEELLTTVLDRLRSELAMSEQYRHGWSAALRCPLGVYVGRSDTSVPASEAEAWQRAVTGPSVVRSFPGGHFFPFGDATAQVVDSILEDFIFTGEAHEL
ncbi:alpha/beta fold hydrolase [Streptomyces sp. NPDC046860]|uniref:thioesterase II family protein n=1 Tax=Streptomyces sp. NPDC046860 TaxID=3154495 RepID=UPI003408AD89